LGNWGATGYWGGTVGLIVIAFLFLRIWETAGFRITERY
jgi:hypothetical protein